MFGDELLGTSVGKGLGGERLHNWKPVFGDNLLGISIGRGLGAPKGSAKVKEALHKG